jgi:hypothetical protein
MGNISRYSPDAWVTDAFYADAALVSGQVVVQGTADGHCTGPSGADIRTGILGVTLNAVSASDVALGVGVADVCRGGIVRCLANGTITRGDRLTVATSAGDVKSFDANITTTGSGAEFVGIALESVTTGQNLGVFLAVGSALGNASTIANLLVGTGGVTAGAVCTFGTGGDAGKIVLPSGADLTLTGHVAGIALTTGIAGATVPVLLQGIGLVTAGDASITTGGMPLAIFGAAGTVKLAAPSAGTNDFIVGYSLAAIGIGTAGAAMINPQVVQG